MDTLLSMRVFVKVAETESFAEAARRLRLSPGMVTKHVQSLERRLGARLLNRTTRRFSLTEAGAAYRDRCLGVLSEIEDIEGAVASLSRQPCGRLRVTTACEFGALELWPMVHRFMKGQPEIRVEMALTNRPLDLIEEEVDVAIRFVNKWRLPPSLVARKLAVTSWIVCASPAYLGEAGTPLVPGDLADHPHIIYNGENGRDQLDLRRGREIHSITRRGVVESSNGSLLRQAAIDGAGIAVLPSYLVHRELADGRLVRLLTGWNSGEQGVYIVFASRKSMPAKTRAFIDFVTAQFTGRSDDDVWLDAAAAPADRRSGDAGRVVPLVRASR